MSRTQDIASFVLFLIGLVIMLNSFHFFDSEKNTVSQNSSATVSKETSQFTNNKYARAELPQPISGNKRDAMIWAISNGQLEIVKKLLAEHVPVHFPFADHKVPIFVAIKYGRTRIFKELLPEVPTLELKNHQGDTMMLYAIKKNRPDIAVILLEAGANWKFKDWGNRTILHWAARIGDLRLVNRIVEKIKVVDPISKGKWTPLHYAAKNGHYLVVRVLLEKGADPKRKLAWGWTPADLARGAGHKDVEKLINDFK